MELYKKFRPESFSDMVGNFKGFEELVNKPKRPHAYLFTGPSGCGKCVTGDTLVSLPKKGLHRIASFSEDSAGFLPRHYEVATRDGVETTSHFYEEEVATTIEAFFSLGASVRGTEKHPLLVFSKGKFSYKKLGALSIGDQVVMRKGLSLYGEGSINYPNDFIKKQHDTTDSDEAILPTKMTKSLAYLLGCIVGNACMSGRYIVISTYSEALLVKLSGISKELDFPFNIDRVNHRFFLSNPKVMHFLEFIFGGPLKTARYKEVPPCVLSAPKEMQVLFLQGLFDCDAHLYSKGLLEYSTASKILKNDVMTMLINMGIISYARGRFIKGYDHVYWKVFISGDDLLAWAALSGDTYKYKYSALSMGVRNTNIKLYKGLLPLIKAARDETRHILKVNGAGHLPDNTIYPAWDQNKREISIARMPMLVKWIGDVEKLVSSPALIHLREVVAEITKNDYLFTEVKSVSRIEELVSVYDFTLPKGHNFIANGIVNHNTTVARILASMFGAKGQDIREYNTGNTRGIDTIREIIANLQASPLMGDAVVYIIDECHQLTTDAQNALLKPLEDTPSHVYFILCTSEPAKVIAAVKTRCFDVNFASIPEDDLFDLIKDISSKEGYKIPGADADLIAKAADGSARKALVILESVLAHPDKNVKEVLSSMGGGDDPAEVMELCRAVFSTGGKKKVAGILSKLKDQKVPSETIRRALLGYGTTILLSGQQDTKIVLDIMRNFMDNTYDTLFPGIAYACLRAMSEETF